MIRESARVSTRAVGDIFKNAYDGASAVKIFSLSRSVQTNLIHSKSFDPIVTSLLIAPWPALISSMPHSIPELGDRLNRGPTVGMCYFRINGYASECERTFFIGEPRDESREDSYHIMKAREKALSVVRPGVRCSDVDTEARSYLIANGYGDNLRHGTGHGIGLDNHEVSWIAENSDQILEENMVISIEPGIYIDDIGGFRHSDMVLVTDCGYELLTKFPVDIDNMSMRNPSRFARLKGSIIKGSPNLQLG